MPSWMGRAFALAAIVSVVTGCSGLLGISYLSNDEADGGADADRGGAVDATTDLPDAGDATVVDGSVDAVDATARDRVVGDGADGSPPDAPSALADSSDAPSATDATDTGCQIQRSAVVLNDAVSIASGGVHACAVRADGTLVCWGDNSHGQLGVSQVTAASPRPMVVQFPAEGGTVSIARIVLGGFASYAVDTQQRLWSWGANDLGQLGIGTQDTQAHPVPSLVNTGAGTPMLVRAIAATQLSAAACAIDTAGALYCWGAANVIGPLIDGGSSVPVHPAQAALQQLGPGVLGGGASAGQLCFVDDTGATAACWGQSLAGVLMTPVNGGGPSVNYAVASSLREAGVSFPVKELQTGAALNYFGCLLDQAGTAYQWAELPPYNGTSFSAIPVPIAFDGGLAHLSAGNRHVCAIAARDGRVYCMGGNSYAMLGNGTLDGVADLSGSQDSGSSTFVPVVTGDGGPLVGTTAISAGFPFTCAIEQGSCGTQGGGTVVCWGSNGNGQLGSEGGIDSSVGVVSPTPLTVLAPAP